MKIKALLIASIIFTGCTTTNHMCDAYSNCDEFYPYSCNDSIRFIAYTPREYKKYVYRHWDYTGYYPNTQTVYYDFPTCIGGNAVQITTSPRPTQIGGDVRVPSSKISNKPNSTLEPSAPSLHNQPRKDARLSRD